MDKNFTKDLYLGFGSNLGDSGHLVTRAIKEVASNSHIELVKQSSLWKTEPLYDKNQPDFVNAVVHFKSDLRAQEILNYTSEIETRFMRQRNPDRPMGPRTLDIDIIFYGDIQMHTERLTIPHPRFHERKFILLPMSEINVNYIVPGTSLSIADLILRCPDKTKLEKI
jgi:2-amino-4-hydroxy-6-hydroxymethyldihydropteridine diphosphokinase